MSQLDSLEQSFGLVDEENSSRLPARYESEFYDFPSRIRPYRRRIVGEGIVMAQSYGFVVKDHLTNIVSMLQHGHAPVWSHMLVARGLVEACVRGCELLDPHCAMSDRVLRANATIIETTEDQHKLARQFRPELEEKANNSLKQVLDRSLRAEIELESSKGRVKRLRLKEQATWRAGGVNVSALVRKWMPDSQDAYSVTSAATHGAIWWLLQDFGSDGFQPRVVSTGYAAIAACTAITAFSSALSELYGRTPEQVREAGDGNIAAINRVIELSDN